MHTPMTFIQAYSSLDFGVILFISVLDFFCSPQKSRQSLNLKRNILFIYIQYMWFLT